MEQECEIAPRATDQVLIAADKNEAADQKSGLEVERNMSIASDGRKRSKIRMVAILTALFVGHSILSDFNSRHILSSC